MKKIFIFLLLLVNINSYAEFKVPQPQPELFVNDYTNTITPEFKQQLLAKIKSFEKISSIQIAIVIINDLQGYEIEDVALAIGRQWGVGQKGLNNGLLYVLSPANRKARIEVGPGIQDEITDAFCNEIQDRVKQYYRNGDYTTGINHIVESVILKLQPISWEQRQKLIAEKEKEQAEMWSKVGDFFLNALLFLLVCSGIGFIIFVVYKQIQKQKKELENAKDDLIKAASNLKNIRDDLYLYNNILPTVPKTIKDIDNLLDLKVHNKTKSIQAVTSLYNYMMTSPDVQNIEREITIHKNFLKLKANINNAISTRSNSLLQLSEDEFNKSYNDFTGVIKEYQILFNQSLVDYNELLSNLIKKKNIVIALRDKLSGAYSDDNFIKTNGKEINNWIGQIENAYNDFISISRYYVNPLIKTKDEIDRLKNAKENFYKQLNTETQKNIQKSYVTKNNIEKMSTYLSQAQLIASEWLSKGKDLKDDLNYYKSLISLQAKINDVYLIDYKEYQRLEAIKEQERRAKEEAERRKREEEERERRRKREQEEEDERRRNSYYSSFYISNSSSSSDISDFGGGSFDGGGSSSSW